MGVVLKQTNCDNCGSSDAYTVYQDSSAYCFSCGKYKNAGIKARLERHKVEVLSSKDIATTYWSKNIPDIAMEWLNKYDLEKSELEGLFWNYKTKSLVMPIWKNSKVVCASNRYFCDSVDAVKSKTEGHKPFITLFHELSDISCACLVEDYISAIKVSRVIPTVPLLGSQVPNKHILFLASRHKNIFVWLDQNKISYSLKLAERLQLLGKSVKVIYTYKDPKYYNTEQISKITGRVNF